MYDIYLILNNVTDKVYIGQSKELKKRWYIHRKSLDKGVHHCAHLQRAWWKYGQSSFEFLIVETNLATVEEANEAEKFFIDWYAEIDLAYNPLWRHYGRGEVSEATRALLSQRALARGAQPPSRKGIPPTTESLEKARLTRLANFVPKKYYCAQCSVNEINAISKYCEECRKIRRKEFYKNYELSEEAKQVLRTRRLGSTMPEEAKAKISASHKGKTPSNWEEISKLRARKFKVLNPKGELVEACNLTQFAAAHGLHPKTLGRLLNGKIDVYRQWKRAE